MKKTKRRVTIAFIVLILLVASGWYLLSFPETYQSSEPSEDVTIIVRVMPSFGGEVEGQLFNIEGSRLNKTIGPGTYSLKWGTRIVFRSSPKAGFVFKEWIVNGKSLSTKTILNTGPILKNLNITAVFSTE